MVPLPHKARYKTKVPAVGAQGAVVLMITAFSVTITPHLKDTTPKPIWIKMWIACTVRWYKKR